jgi:hypothetical protein
VPSSGAGTGDLILSGDGRTLYASSTTGGAGGGIAVLRRDVATGSVRELAGHAGCLGVRRLQCVRIRGLDEVLTIAFSPDGRFAYALSGDIGDDALAIFRVTGPS